MCEIFNAENTDVSINNFEVAKLVKKFNDTGDVLIKKEMKEIISPKQEYLQDDID